MRLSAILLVCLVLSCAYFASFSATLSSEASLNLSSAPSLNGSFDENDTFTYESSKGDYKTSISSSPQGILVSVSGTDESQPALSNELEALISLGVIETKCDPRGFAPLSTVDYYCSEQASWSGCATPETCNQMPVPEQYEEPSAEAAVPKAAQESLDFGIEAKTAGTAPRAPQEPELEGEKLGTWQALQALGAFVLIIVASYLILQQRQAQVEISAHDTRLLENKTRAGIMEQLSEADRIPTDLSSKLGKSKATISEHLEALQQAGLVEKLATPGRKFVYYRLTRKGKHLLLRRAG